MAGAVSVADGTASHSAAVDFGLGLSLAVSDMNAGQTLTADAVDHAEKAAAYDNTLAKIAADKAAKTAKRKKSSDRAPETSAYKKARLRKSDGASRDTR